MFELEWTVGEGCGKRQENNLFIAPPHTHPLPSPSFFPVVHPLVKISRCSRTHTAIKIKDGSWNFHQEKTGNSVAKIGYWWSQQAWLTSQYFPPFWISPSLLQLKIAKLKLWLQSLFTLSYVSCSLTAQQRWHIVQLQWQQPSAVGTGHNPETGSVPQCSPVP